MKRIYIYGIAGLIVTLFGVSTISFADTVPATDAGLVFTESAPLLLAQAESKDNRDNRQDGRQDGRDSRGDSRDENQDGRDDNRDDRQDCRDEEGVVGDDKRDCKQQG